MPFERLTFDIFSKELKTQHMFTNNIFSNNYQIIQLFTIIKKIGVLVFYIYPLFGFGRICIWGLHSYNKNKTSF